MGFLIRTDTNPPHHCKPPEIYDWTPEGDPDVIGVGSLWRCDGYVLDLFPCQQCWVVREDYYANVWNKISNRKAAKLMKKVRR